MKQWKKWKYKNLTISAAGLLVAILLSRNTSFHDALVRFGSVGYAGAFLGGMLFVSTYTVATGAVVLSILEKQLSPIQIGLVAGLGAVAGDLLIFSLVKNSLTSEIRRLYNRIDRKRHLEKLFHTPYFSWTLPVIGALIIASPLPDELGVSLLGIAGMNSLRFTVLSYVLNTSGILLILAVSRLGRP